MKLRSSVGVEFNISDNKALFDKLAGHKDEINAEIGVDLDWKRLDEKKACCIVVEKTFRIDDEKDWPAEFDWMMDIDIKKKKVFKQYM